MRLNMLWQDFSYGLRLLRKAPGFAIVAILTIAIGIGGTTSLFSIVNGVLLQPLPYKDAGQLLALPSSDRARSLNGMPVSLTKYERLKQNARTLDEISAYYVNSVSLKVSVLPEQVVAARATRNFFDVLAVSPMAGRIFRPEEDAPGGEPVMIVSYHLWQNRFGGDPNIIGRVVPVDGRATTIIGVLPATFQFPFQQPEPEVWLPNVAENPSLGTVRVHSGAGYLQLFAKVKPGIALGQAQSDLHAVDVAYRQDNPGFADAPLDLAPAPLKESLVGPIRQSLLALLTAVLFVLLIGCTNLANLLLAKANGRRKELAIRAALGATRFRLICQLLTEAIVISVIGGSLGVLLAFGTKWLLRLLPAGTLPRVDEVGISGTVLLFSACLTILSGIVFGFLPSLRASRPDVNEALKESSRGSTSGRHSGRARAVLVGAQVAFAVLLLSGAGMLMKSFTKLVEIDPGFNGDHVITMSVPIPTDRYSVEQERRLLRQLLTSVRALPGVQSVGAVDNLPLVGISRIVYTCYEGAVCNGVGKDPVTASRTVMPGYFESMGIPVLRGRTFNDHDDENSQAVAVISEKTANLYFPKQDPIGKWIANSRDMTRMVIVGVVKDVHILGLNVPAFQEMFRPQAQSAEKIPNMSLIVHSNAPFRPLVDSVRRELAQLDPDIPLANIATLDDGVAASIAQPRLTTQLGGVFAIIALLLTCIGIYGVLAYLVSQQTQEIGVRMALGATPRHIVGQVLGHGVRIVGIGLTVGLVASLIFMRLLQSLLFGTSARDPIILSATAVAVFAVGLLACYVPALRAARVSPTVALQQ